MCVLHVVDGVLLRPLRGEVDVDVDRLVVPTRDEVPARGVDANLLRQLMQEDDVAAAFGDLLRLAALDDVHELVDEHLDAFGVVAEHRRGRLQARDIPVMIGAEDVDRAVEAALQLVPHVRDVGGEVEVRAVFGANQRPVLVVAVRARPCPQGPLGLVCVELRS